MKVRTQREPMRVAFLLVPQFSLMSFSAAIEPLRAANRVCGVQLFEWQLVSVDGHAVSASNGISIEVHQPLAELKKIDMLVVCAGLEPQQFQRRHMIHHHLRRLARHGSMVGAISTGSFILADAGLLADRRCTVHWEYADAFRLQYPTLATSADLYVVDPDVFTCSGGTAALDMMLHFVREASSLDVAVAVADQFIHPQIRSQEANQRIETHTRYGIDSPKLVEIIRLMEKAIEHPLHMKQISVRVAVSVRQIERAFREQLRASPKDFYLKLRLGWARTLLRQTVQPLSTVGLGCGFRSTSHFCHAYKRIYGIAPSEERHTMAWRQGARLSGDRLEQRPPGFDVLAHGKRGRGRIALR
jgi:transcriptional regulator GlxA family with amidase domain